MTEPRVSLHEVSLCYRLAKQRIPSLKEYAIHWMRGALTYESLWALKDVSLEVTKGEKLGIVGRNGAGKSTLLKVISRILKPTKGKVDVRGFVAPILELGTGFDAELTGLENIYLNALLLGHTRREIDDKVEDIVGFSELGEFIYTPTRNYSSGMVARLGFAIATAWIPEVLILDEVLSVGDTAFVQRCEARLGRFHEAGTTLILVSHSASAIRKNCTRCIRLDHGAVVDDGEPEEVLQRYEESAQEDAGVRAAESEPAPIEASVGQ